MTDGPKAYAMGHVQCTDYTGINIARQIRAMSPTVPGEDDSNG